jgi:hypothetical protein
MDKESKVLIYRCEIIGDRLSGGHRFSHKYPKGTKLSTNWNKLPPPQQDGIPEMKMQQDWCGCKDLKQFFKWWNKSQLKHHSANRNRLAILEVPTSEVKYGKHQVVFNRKKAKIVGKINEKGEAVFNSNYLRQTRKST